MKACLVLFQWRGKLHGISYDWAGVAEGEAGAEGKSREGILARWDLGQPLKGGKWELIEALEDQEWDEFPGQQWPHPELWRGGGGWWLR